MTVRVRFRSRAIAFTPRFRGNGATVRFVLLPLEAHVYAGRASLETLMAETKAWLDTYVKEAK